MSYPTNPILFYDSQFRQYRVRLRNNSFVKIKRKIRTPQQLKAILDKLMPEDCYQSISHWLSPEFLGAKGVVDNMNKPKYPLREDQIYLKALYRYKKIAHNCFLGLDYVLDFDLKDYKSLEEMESNVSLAHTFLKEQGMVKHHLQRTPSGGRQLVIFDFNKWANVHKDLPTDREAAYMLKMKQLTSMLLKAGVKWDYNVSNDTRRVIRIPNTVRLSTGRRASLIEYLPEYIIR